MFTSIFGMPYGVRPGFCPHIVYGAFLLAVGAIFAPTYAMAGDVYQCNDAGAAGRIAVDTNSLGLTVTMPRCSNMSAVPLSNATLTLQRWHPTNPTDPAAIWQSPGVLPQGWSMLTPNGWEALSEVQSESTAPTIPTGVVAVAQSSSSVTVTWTVSTDNGGPGVGGYRVYRNGSMVGTTTSTTFTDTGLLAGTTYSYTVAAFDTSSNTTSQSATAKATTFSASGGTGQVYQCSDAGAVGRVVVDTNSLGRTVTMPGCSNMIAVTLAGATLTLQRANPGSLTDPYAIWQAPGALPTGWSIYTPSGWETLSQIQSGTPSSASSSTTGSTTGSSTTGSTTGSSTTGSSAAAGGQIQYPRLSWGGIGGAQNYASNQSALVAFAQHMDLVVLGGNWEGSATAYGYNRGKLVNSILSGDGTVTPKVVQYNVFDHYNIDNGTSPSPASTPIWGAQLNAMSAYWFLYQPGGAHTNNAFGGAGDWQTNSVDLGAASKDGNGNALEAAAAAYQDGYYRTGGTADAAPNISGSMRDNFFFVLGSGAVCGDYLHTGSSVCGSDPVVAAAWRSGQNEWIQWFRAHAPGQFLMANVNYTGNTPDRPNVPYYLRPPADSAPIYGALDADSDEALMGQSYSVETWAGFEGMRELQQFHDAAVKSPQFNVASLEGANANGQSPDANLTASVGQAFRYFMCANLVTSLTTIDITGGSNLDPSGSYTALFWFDYFAVNPDTGVALNYASSTSAQIAAARYWLGTPIDGIQTAPTQGKVYARRFRMTNGRTGLVLVNPSTNGGNNGAAPQTINLTAAFGGSWTHITASNGSNVGSNSSVDNGATVSNVTVPVGDGVILIQ